MGFPNSGLPRQRADPHAVGVVLLVARRGSGTAAGAAGELLLQPCETSEARRAGETGAEEAGNAVLLLRRSAAGDSRGWDRCEAKRRLGYFA